MTQTILIYRHTPVPLAIDPGKSGSGKPALLLGSAHRIGVPFHLRHPARLRAGLVPINAISTASGPEVSIWEVQKAKSGITFSRANHVVYGQSRPQLSTTDEVKAYQDRIKALDKFDKDYLKKVAEFQAKIKATEKKGDDDVTSLKVAAAQKQAMAIKETEDKMANAVYRGENEVEKSRNQRHFPVTD